MIADKHDQPANDAETDPEAERIVSEIEETRTEMGATIDQIGHRLQPQTIASDAKDKIREATVGRVERIVDDAGQTAQRTSNTLMDTIRQNPVPAALAAVGVGWLALRMRDQQSGNGNSGRNRAGYGYGYGSSYANSSDYGDYRSAESDPFDRARGTAQDVADQAAQRAQQVGSDVQRAAQTAVEGTQQKVHRAQWQVDRTWNENPLALGALAVGVGAAVALAIPETEKERELMGEQRDKLVQKVSTVATQALDEAQTKAHEVAEEVTTEQAADQGESKY